VKMLAKVSDVPTLRLRYAEACREYAIN
jgi:hypothetical protein